MAKLGLLASSNLFIRVLVGGTLVGALTFASFSPPTAEAAEQCKTTTFKTELVKDACTTGGQKAAKSAMKKWMKSKKLKSCNKCHSKLAPSYPLKKDGVDQFVKLGGKLLPGAKAK